VSLRKQLPTLNNIPSWVDEIRQIKDAQMANEHQRMTMEAIKQGWIDPSHAHEWVENEGEIAPHTHSVGAGAALQALRRSPDDPIELRKMLAMRMRGRLPFAHVYCQLVNPEGKIVVFLIVNNEPVTLEDNFDLFPSDALITKLRLLAG
jgi:hypothetical protein